MLPLSALDRFNPLNYGINHLSQAEFTLPSARPSSLKSSGPCISGGDNTARWPNLAIPCQTLKTGLAALIRSHAAPTVARQGISLATLVAMFLNSPAAAFAADASLEAPDVSSPTTPNTVPARLALSPNQGRQTTFKAPELTPSLPSPGPKKLDDLRQIVGAPVAQQAAPQDHEASVPPKHTSSPASDTGKGLSFALRRIHDFLRATAEIEVRWAEAESLDTSMFSGHPEVEAEALRIKSDAKNAVKALRSERYGDQGMFDSQAEFRSAMWRFSRLQAKFHENKEAYAILVAATEAIQQKSDKVRYPAYQQQINAPELASRISELQNTIGTKKFQAARRWAQNAIKQAESAHKNYLYIEETLEIIRAKASTESVKRNNQLFTADPEFSSIAYAKMAEEPLILAHDLYETATTALQSGKRFDPSAQNQIFAALKRSDDLVERFKAGARDLKASRDAVAPVPEAIEKANLPSTLRGTLSGMLASYSQNYATNKSALLAAQPVNTAATLIDASALKKTIAFYIGAAERINQATQQVEALKELFDSLKTDTGRKELEAFRQAIDAAASLVYQPPAKLLASPSYRTTVDIALSKVKSQLTRTQMELVRAQIQVQSRKASGGRNPGLRMS
jgi:hypothetical protein